jgi:hypothetical protein
VIVTNNYHGYDSYRCEKEVIVTTNYHGYYYRCDKVVIVTTNYNAMTTIDVIKY